MSLLFCVFVALFYSSSVFSVAIYMPDGDTYIVGEAGTVQWDLDGGNFDQLEFNLNWAGALKPLQLTIINTDGLVVGKTEVNFPQLLPGPYHLEAVWPAQTALVGIGPIFTLLASTLTQTDTVTPDTVTTPARKGISTTTTKSEKSKASSTSAVSTTVPKTSTSSETSLTTLGPIAPLSSSFPLPTVTVTETDSSPAAATGNGSNTNGKNLQIAIIILGTLVGTGILLTLVLTLIFLLCRYNKRKTETIREARPYVLTPAISSSELPSNVGETPNRKYPVAGNVNEMVQLRAGPSNSNEPYLAETIGDPPAYRED